MVPARRGLWFGLLLLGVMMIALGAFLIAEPHETLGVIATLVGILLIVDGVFAVFGAILGKGEGRTLLAIVGLIGVVAGIVLVRKPFAGVLAVVLLVGVWFIVTGVARLVYGVSAEEGRAGAIAVAALDLLAGVLLVAVPDLGAAALATIVGIVLIVRGGLFCWAAWGVLRAEGGPGGPAPPAPA